MKEGQRLEYDQGCEPATPFFTVGVLVEFEGTQVSHAHPPTTESEYLLDSMDIFQESGELGRFSPMN